MKVKLAPPARYHDGDGLALLVRSVESAFWMFRYMRDGRSREAGLGRARVRNAVPLSVARENGAAPCS
ncbi:Arm DNA-binding domain-containing protein [Endosaccharibacter trunci]|uniref:Arm DNA-binding domain-containing protein n=1 Tax=Endosaccharibacter trunci TaxID=2812733 RepID=UPI003BF5EC43